LFHEGIAVFYFTQLGLLAFTKIGRIKRSRKAVGRF